MSIKIMTTSPEMDIEVKKSRFEGLVITQGDDIVYVSEDLIKLFVSAVHAVGYDIVGKELDE